MDLPRLQRTPSGWLAGFAAMASPCELLVDGADEATARHLAHIAQAEALRVEARYSRYRSDSLVACWQAARGQPVELDDEAARLMDTAAQCHALSGGLFDITSGVLRAAWRFDGSQQAPEPAQVTALLPRVGFDKLQWRRPWLTVPVGMEVDLGGLAKEYAVDRALALLCAESPCPVLVNFGGDLAVSGPRAAGEPWQVGLASLARPGGADAVLALRAGALATSGDAHRHFTHAGRRYGHILDPRTGWPVQGAPRAVTVAAPTCTEAGLLATLALLQGPQARAWLQAQDVVHWLVDPLSEEGARG